VEKFAQNLSTSIQIGPLSLEHRVVMAPPDAFALRAAWRYSGRIPGAFCARDSIARVTLEHLRAGEAPHRIALAKDRL
jgi:hypothetical protein